MESTASSGKQFIEGDSRTARLIAERLDRGVQWVEKHPPLIWAVLAVIYLVKLPAPLQKILWYDELHTYYIAQAPTIAKYFELVSHTDLNPPLIYAFARLSFDLFGVSSLALRLPSILAFFLGSMLVLVFLSKRLGWLWAAAAVALFWYSPYFFYATDARPYGILLAFFGLTLFSWDTVSSHASQGAHSITRRWGLAGIAIGNTGMMLSHALAPLSIMPFCVAELYRSIQRRRVDLAVWAALLLPLVWGLLSLASVQKMGAVTYPPAFAASFGKVYWFFLGALLPMLSALCLFTPASLVIAAWGRDASSAKPGATLWQAPFLIASLVTPLVANMALMFKRGPFFDRYCITTALVLYLGIMVFLARRCWMNRVAGMLVLLVLVALNVAEEAPYWSEVFNGSPVSETRLDLIKPELPFVVGNALTFLEMDHQESPPFLSRVHYLTDRPSALRYAQTDLMEGIGDLKRYFPIRANIDPYNDFVSQYPHFLVFGSIDRAEDWVLRKVIAEGAHVTKIGEPKTLYRERTLYEVTLVPQGNAAP